MSKPTEEQINQVLDKCGESEEAGISEYPGMTYEQGVRAGIEWVKGWVKESPLD